MVTAIEEADVPLAKEESAGPTTALSQTDTYSSGRHIQEAAMAYFKNQGPA